MKNYHTHTKRCHHAIDNEEDYIQAAIASGYTELGFSDHSPWMYQSSFHPTMRMEAYEIGDYVEDFAGPLGQPSEMINEDIDSLKGQNILFVAGGVGAAPVYPQVKWLYEQGIKADVIIGARTKDLIILEEEMKKVAGNLYVSTDDGSYGFNGRVTDMLNYLVNNQNKKYDHSIVIGPMIMMKFMASLLRS